MDRQVILEGSAKRKPNKKEKPHAWDVVVVEKPDNNHLMPIANYKQILKAKWDIDSPRFKLACFKLGIDAKNQLRLKERSELAQKGDSDKIIALRHRHSLKKLRNLLNEVIVERRKICLA
jgi:hypothetical protein